MQIEPDEVEVSDGEFTIRELWRAEEVRRVLTGCAQSGCVVLEEKFVQRKNAEGRTVVYLAMTCAKCGATRTYLVGTEVGGV